MYFFEIELKLLSFQVIKNVNNHVFALKKKELNTNILFLLNKAICTVSTVHTFYLFYQHVEISKWYKGYSCAYLQFPFANTVYFFFKKNRQYSQKETANMHKNNLYTILKSPHVDKKARSQYKQTFFCKKVYLSLYTQQNAMLLLKTNKPALQINQKVKKTLHFYTS